MAWNLTQGFTLNSGQKGVGGFRAFYFIQKRYVTTLVRSFGKVSSIATSGGNTFYKYDVQRGTASFSESFSWKTETGLKVYEQSATLKIVGTQKSVREEISNLAKYPLLIVMEDRNGVFWVMGESVGAFVESVNAQISGEAGGERGVTISFKASEFNLAPSIDASVFATVYTGSLASGGGCGGDFIWTSPGGGGGATEYAYDFTASGGETSFSYSGFAGSSLILVMRSGIGIKPIFSGSPSGSQVLFSGTTFTFGTPLGVGEWVRVICKL